jgi:hypothetical protein
VFSVRPAPELDAGRLREIERLGLYEHLGFRVLEESRVGPQLLALRQRERARGLEVRPRVCMCLDLV